MTVRVLHGDCRDVLRTLPDQSVHCCVTSPPYYGLRDYQTATWEGGDPECSHQVGEIRTGLGMAALSEQYRGGGKKAAEPKPMFAKSECPHCGARRIDRQMGLEDTPEQFVAGMVEVFREVRRVLRDDGTLWLNLGSSYVSSDTSPSPSRLRKRVPAYDSGDTALEDLSGIGRAYPDSDDGRQGGSTSHRASRTGSAPPAELARTPLSTTSHGIELGGSSEARACGVRPDAPESSTLSFLPSGQDVPGLASAALVSPLSPETSSLAWPASSRKSGGSDGTGPISGPSFHHRSDTELSEKACDCGSCGICWAYLAIPALRLKAKDLLQMPHLLALALQADGWHLRSEIIWQKPNPMPESVMDRPTKAHEQIFLLTKSARYYYDAEAIKEVGVIAAGTKGAKGSAARAATPGVNSRPPEYKIYDGTRNARSVWTIATRPYPEAHFATFPPDLPERCIKAGTSERGCCAACGAPWVRMVEKNLVPTAKAAKRNVVDQRDYAADTKDQDANRQKDGHVPGLARQDITLGWEPSCQCNAATIPCTILDPFGGAGTTGLVADRLQRDAILIELNPKYAEMARRRIADDAGLLGVA